MVLFLASTSDCSFIVSFEKMNECPVSRSHLNLSQEPLFLVVFLLVLYLFYVQIKNNNNSNSNTKQNEPVPVPTKE